MATKTLNKRERYILGEVARRVANCMGWDEQLGAYADGGNFTLQLSTDQLNELQSAVEKIKSTN